jgi:hypothetical protein
MLKLIESKATGLSELPPAIYQKVRTTPDGRCLFCGHPTSGDGCVADRCNCLDCFCCTSEETTDGRGLD